MPKESIINQSNEPQALVAAGLGRGAMLERAGKRDEARTEFETALAGARATPYEIEFLTRIQLVMMLADNYLESGAADLATALLAEEIAFATRIAEIMRATGAPDQKRAANGGLMQLRDRAAQVKLMGNAAPDISVAEWVRGEPATLADLRGQVVLLEFWATWCQPCRDMFPRLLALHEKFAGQGLEIVALTRFYMSHEEAAGSRAQELELIAQAASDAKLVFRVGVAEDERAQETYGANGLPTLIIIDRKSDVRWAGHSGEDIHLETMLERYLQERP
jgi:thiol-disulfide isomerase/thioredoxin